MLDKFTAITLFLRETKQPTRKISMKYQHRSSMPWTRMKGTIHVLLRNQHVTYVEEEVSFLLLQTFTFTYSVCLPWNWKWLISTARAEIGEFVEYDLDKEDEDWLKDFNNEQKNLIPEK
jgi:hypothetical protein